ncbi:MAG TPA: GNAT family N-acetyltransferase [Gaiellaceae bacterium]|nr:GNAT family N-acetyltransferase [Gaiellaceae bacterium]
MSRLEVHPLSELRDEAAGLLAERYARQRAAEPLLPEIGDFERQLPADGLVATRGGEAVAYLAGEVDGERGLADRPFGGHAAREPDALQDLFALQAARLGVSRFMVAVPASNPDLVDAWFRLAFGCQAVWAVREVEPPEPVPFDGTIRLSVPDDLEEVIAFDEILYRHQASSPSFSEYDVPPRERLRADAADMWDEQYTPVVAERDGRIVGLLVLYRRPEGDLRVPERTIDLAFAATRDEVRGTGAGRALTAWAFRWAAEHGFRSMTVDWRSVNLLAARFWARRGFRPQYLRLYRAVP